MYFRHSYPVVVKDMKLKAILRFFKCMESMAWDPYIPSTTVLGDMHEISEKNPNFPGIEPRSSA